MIELDIAIAFILLLVVVWFFLKLRKKKLSTSIIKDTPESVKPAKQQPKPAETVVSSTDATVLLAERKTVAPQQVQEPVTHPVEPEQKPPVAQASNKAADTIAEKTHKNLPQDSMLRRHYLTHLHAIIATLNPACPTDSMLRRHYDALIAAKIEQCLDSKEAMQQLMHLYENHKKTLVCCSVAQTPVASSPDCKKTHETVATQASVSKIPEDSMLRRHYLTQLYAQAAAKLPARPTDSTLRRHYDTMLENEVKNQLA